MDMSSNGGETQKPLEEHNVPRNWWQNYEVCTTLAKVLEQHILGMLIGARRDNQSTLAYAFTGIKVMYQEQLLWFTAGHVISELNTLDTSGAHIEAQFWLDKSHSEDADYVPVLNKDFPRFTARSEDIDFGFGIVSGLDKEQILSNPLSIPITEQFWVGIGEIEPDGYVLIGYPNEFSRLTQTPETETQTRNSFNVTTLCLPVERISIAQLPASMPADFAREPAAFYGRIMPFLNVEEVPDIHIGGMSGGPIFSVRYTDEGIVCHLVAVQAKWFRSQKVICAHSINTIMKIVDTQLSKMTPPSSP